MCSMPTDKSHSIVECCTLAALETGSEIHARQPPDLWHYSYIDRELLPVHTLADIATERVVHCAGSSLIPKLQLHFRVICSAVLNVSVYSLVVT